MRYYADLHIHSRFSRATSRDCDLEQLSVQAQRKGVAVVDTGLDCSSLRAGAAALRQRCRALSRADGRGSRHFLARLAGWCARWPWTTLGLAALLTVGSIVVSMDLEIRTGRLDLAPQDDPVARSFIAFTKEFGALNRLVAVVTGERAREAAAALEARLEAMPDMIADASAKVNLDAYLDQFLFTLSADRLERLRREVEDSRFELGAMARAPTMATLFERLRRPGRLRDAPSIERIHALTAMVRYLGGQGDLRVPTMSELLGKPSSLPARPTFLDREGYFTSQDGKKRLVMVRARDASDSNQVVVPFVRTVQETADAVAAEFRVEVELGGFPALKVSEKQAADYSIAASTIFSFVAVLGLFMMTFRSRSLPVLSMATLSLSVIWTAAFATLTLGHLTIVSASFASILLGLGDFSTHLVARFEQELPRSADVEEAVLAAADEMAPGILTGSATTACAFLCMLATGFPAFQGLGVTAGAGIVLALIETFTVLPAAMVLWLGRQSADRDLEPPMTAFFKDLADRLCNRPELGLLLMAGLALVTLRPSWALTLDPDFEKMNDPRSTAVRVQGSLLHDFGFSSTINVLVVETVAQLERAVDLLEREPTVGMIDSPARLVPADPVRNVAGVARLRDLVAAVGPFGNPAGSDPGRLRRAAANLESQVGKLRLLYLVQGKPQESVAAEELRAALGELATVPDPDLVARDAYLVGQIRDMVHDLERATAGKPKTLATSSPALLAPYRGSGSRLAVFFAPCVDVAKPAENHRFNVATRRIAAAVGAECTGNALVFEQMVDLLVWGYGRTVEVSLVLITLLVLANFRDPLAAGLTLAVAGLGIMATRASMQLGGISLNPANLIGVPLILGLGVDNAVHLIHLWLEGEPMAETLAETGRPLTMNTATSVVGFGGLMLARHQGLYSLGWCLAVGITWCWVITMILVPSAILMVDRLRKDGFRPDRSLGSYRMS